MLQVRLQLVPQNIQHDSPHQERDGIRNDKRPDDPMETIHSIGDVEYRNQSNPLNNRHNKGSGPLRCRLENSRKQRGHSRNKQG